MNEFPDDTPVDPSLIDLPETAFNTKDYELDPVVVAKLDRYFEQLEGRHPHPLYELVIHAVERPLLLYAMGMCQNNQCAAAKLLGINRNTLRKKLTRHGLFL